MLPHYQLWAIDYTVVAFLIGNSRFTRHYWLFCGSELHPMYYYSSCFESKKINSEGKSYLPTCEGENTRDSVFLKFDKPLLNTPTSYG